MKNTIWIVAVLALAGGFSTVAQSGDPPANSLAFQQFPQFGVPGGSDGKDAPLVKVEAAFTVPAADGSAQLVVTAKIESGWHIYSLTQGTGGPVASRVEVDKAESVQVVGAFQATATPDVKSDPGFPGLPIETHDKKITWFAPIKVAGGDPQTLKIVGRVHAQACNDSNCAPPKDYEFTAELSKELALQKAAPLPAAPPSASPASPPATNPQSRSTAPPNKSTAEVAAHDSTPAAPDLPEPSFDLNGSPDSFNSLGESAEHVHIEAGFTKPDAAGKAQLIVTAKIDRGWHIYSLTQPQGGPVATTVRVAGTADYRLAGPFLPKDAPRIHPMKGSTPPFEERYEHEATWMAPVQILAKSPQQVKIEGIVSIEACTEKNCTPPHDVPFTAEFSPKLVPLTPTNWAPAPVVPHATTSIAANQEQLSWQPYTSLTALNALLGKDVDLKMVQDFIADQARRRYTVIGALFFGFLGGLILNIMPCVLPVIGLKIMSFIDQSGHNRGKAFLLNVWYSLGLLAVFFLLASLAVFANLGWGALFARPWFIISLTGLVFTMGLSFLGVWEIPIPGFAGRTAESDFANQEGATGAFVKGALTTVLATPCTAPFLGPALVWAAAQPPWLTYAVMLSAGLGMAFPYLLIGAFPELISFLPKPGKWMETLKHVMGFVLMGTVVFFLSSLDTAFVVPTVGMLFALWAACWWIGRVSPFASGYAKSTAWAQATAFAVIVAVLMFPTFDELIRPRLGFASLTSIMRDRLGYIGGVAPARPVTGGWVMAAGRPRAVMIDFTATWCGNCHVFEVAVLDQRSVVDAVQRHNVLPLRADFTVETPEVKQLLKVLNAGTTQIPVLAIFNPKKPNEPIVFPGPCSESELLEAIDKVAPLEKAAATDTTWR